MIISYKQFKLAYKKQYKLVKLNYKLVACYQISFFFNQMSKTQTINSKWYLTKETLYKNETFIRGGVGPLKINISFVLAL